MGDPYITPMPQLSATALLLTFSGAKVIAGAMSRADTRCLIAF